jgi:hypothetical protein
MLARRPEREAADGADLLLELAGRAGVDGEVAGVMRARRELVDHEAIGLIDEELDAEDADDIEAMHDLAGDIEGLVRDCVAHLGGTNGEVEDVIAMAILNGSVGYDLTIAPADGDDGDFALKIDEVLPDRV